MAAKKEDTLLREGFEKSIFTGEMEPVIEYVGFKLGSNKWSFKTKQLTMLCPLMLQKDREVVASFSAIVHVEAYEKTAEAGDCATVKSRSAGDAMRIAAQKAQTFATIRALSMIDKDFGREFIDVAFLLPNERETFEKIKSEIEAATTEHAVMEAVAVVSMKLKNPHLINQINEISGRKLSVMQGKKA